MASYQYVYVMKGLRKVFPGGKEVLKNVYLSFLPGAKIGVVGLNFLASRAAANGPSPHSETSPLDSRHAIVIDSLTGGLRFKGKSMPRALPREHVLRPGEARPVPPDS